MSVNYDLYETPNPDKEGEVLPLHARVVLKGSYTAEEIAELQNESNGTSGSNSSTAGSSDSSSN